MYGSVARMRVKAGHEEALLKAMDTWDRDRKPKVKGAIGGYCLRPDNNRGEMILLAVFQDEQTYRANAADPEQDRWYHEVRAHLEADPSWEDGEIVHPRSV